MQPSQAFKNGRFRLAFFCDFKDCLFRYFSSVLIDLKATATLRLFCMQLFPSGSICSVLLLRMQWYPCYVGHFPSTLIAKDENKKKDKRFAVQGPCSFKASAYRKARNVKLQCINLCKLY